MTYSLRRREVLQASGLVAAGTFAGCSGSGDDPVYTSIYLRHYANDRLSTDIKVYPWEDDSSEFLFWQTPKLEQQADGPHRVYEDAFETQRAIVDIDAGKLTGDPDIKEQFTYIPNCPPDSARKGGHSLSIRLDPEADHLGTKVQWEATCGGTD
jgi:hypothetical protein